MSTETNSPWADLSDVQEAAKQMIGGIEQLRKEAMTEGTKEYLKNNSVEDIMDAVREQLNDALFLSKTTIQILMINIQSDLISYKESLKPKTRDMNQVEALTYCIENGYILVHKIRNKLCIETSAVSGETIDNTKYATIEQLKNYQDGVTKFEDFNDLPKITISE